jgi:hypothetical protein
MTFKRKLRVARESCMRAVCCLQGGKITTEGTEKCGGGNAEQKKRGVSLRREFFQYATILPLRASTRRWLFGRD